MSITEIVKHPEYNPESSHIVRYGRALHGSSCSRGSLFGGVKMNKLTQKRLKELLDYNPETGVFTWKISRRGRSNVGEQAGYVNQIGYHMIGVDYKLYQASRLAWLFMEGYFPEYDCDHINRIRTDNRWINLRHVSRQCNIRNSGRRSTNTSGITGVSWCKQYDKWVVGIGISGKVKHLGYFKDFTEAVKARWEAEIESDWPGCNSHSDAYCYLHTAQTILDIGRGGA